MPEDFELRRRQADPPLAALDAPLEVDHEVAMTDDAAADSVAEVTVCPPQQGLDPGLSPRRLYGLVR